MRWHLRSGRSYRDPEEILAERGIDVDHVTLYRWVDHPGLQGRPDIQARLRLLHRGEAAV